MSFFTKLKQSRRERLEAEVRSAQEAFWTWFRSNTGFFETYAENTTEVVGEIGKRIDAINRQLTFEMGRADDGIYEFIVSADGLRDVFPDVVALTKAAPSIPGWRIIAFRPRKKDPSANAVGFQGMELGAGAIWYRSSPQEDRIDLTLCVEGQDENGALTMLGPVFLLLDVTLGEFDVATRIGCIEFADCPTDPNAAGFRPLPDLAREVDARFAPAAA